MALDNNQIENSNIKNDEISLKELFMKVNNFYILIKSRWKIIFTAGVIGALIGLAIGLFEKPIFKALITFAMEEDKSNGGGGLSGALGLASSFGIDIGGSGGGAFAASNIAELMKSQFIVEKVLLNPIEVKGKNISLIEHYIQFNNLRKNWGKNPNLKNIIFLPNSDRNKFSLQQDSILHNIYKNIFDKEVLSIMQKDKKVTILSIVVTSENELFSKIFCESLAKETSDFYIQTKSKKARTNADVLQKQVDSVRNCLNFAIIGVANETDNVYNLNPAFNLKGTPSKQKQIDVQANTAILTNLVVQLELAKITLRKETPLIQLIDRPILPLEKQKIGKLLWIIIGSLFTILSTILYITFSHIYKRIIL
jgi:hypothetical protein